MNFKIISLSYLNDNRINQLARLHHKEMESLLSDLGLPFVERYYQTARADSSVIGACALGVAGNPLGWGIGSPRPNQVNRRMREAWGWFIVQMLRVLLTNPKLIWQVFVSSQTSSIAMKAGAVELTYIGVDSSARKQGLGSELLSAFIEAAREKKFRTVELSVDADNTAAIALYTRAGFETIASFKEGRFNRHRMELIL